MSFPGIFGEHGAFRDVKDGLTCVIQTRSEEGCRNDVSQISLLLARALWKCPTPRAMTASRGKGQLGQSGRSAGERDCKTPDPSLCDVVLFVQLLTVV